MTTDRRTTEDGRYISSCLADIELHVTDNGPYISYCQYYNIQETAHAGNPTRNIQSPLIQKTHIHMQPHTHYINHTATC